MPIMLNIIQYRTRSGTSVIHNYPMITFLSSLTALPVCRGSEFQLIDGKISHCDICCAQSSLSQICKVLQSMFHHFVTRLLFECTCGKMNYNLYYFRSCVVCITFVSVSVEVVFHASYQNYVYARS